MKLFSLVLVGFLSLLTLTGCAQPGTSSSETYVDSGPNSAQSAYPNTGAPRGGMNNGTNTSAKLLSPITQY